MFRNYLIIMLLRNQGTLINSREFNSYPSPSTFELDNCEVRPRPMGQKAAKRKGKFKAKETMDDNTQWNNMLDIQSQKL